MVNTLRNRRSGGVSASQRMTPALRRARPKDHVGVEQVAHAPSSTAPKSTARGMSCARRRSTTERRGVGRHVEHRLHGEQRVGAASGGEPSVLLNVDHNGNLVACAGIVTRPSGLAVNGT
jgi:hypothetical protein